MWTGTLDKNLKFLTDGNVLTKKKRFGFIPYTESLATFSAKVLLPSESLPKVALPDFMLQDFAVRAFHFLIIVLFSKLK